MIYNQGLRECSILRENGYPEHLIKYIESILLDEMVEVINRFNNNINHIEPVMEITLSDLSDKLNSFEENIKTNYVPKTGDKLTNNLYSPFLSSLPIEKMIFPMEQHTDHRGKYTELIRTMEYGQFSVSHSKPGIIRGRHYHHSKNERFIVAYGKRDDVDDYKDGYFKHSGVVTHGTENNLIVHMDHDGGGTNPYIIVNHALVEVLEET